MTDSTKTEAKQLAEWSERHYGEALSSVVRALHDMTDRVAREGMPSDVPSAAGTPRFAHAAEAVLHAITWGVANDVIRRLREGWMPPTGGFAGWWPQPGETGDTWWLPPSRGGARGNGTSEPMTDAEWAVLDAVAGPNDTEDTDG